MDAYSLVGEVRRFSQRDSVFERAKWDPTCAVCRTPRRPAEEIIASGKRGYAREDFALMSGAWGMAGHLTEFAGDVPRANHRESVRRADAERFEPEDLGAFTQQVKSAARLFGASLVGIARVNPLWLYAGNARQEAIELPEGMDTAVVMAIEMNYDLIRTSPSARAAAATGDGYSRMDAASARLARYLTELGWRAIPCANGMALSIPLAIDAGLGEPGRNGLLITAEYGPRVRLCKVFTDAPLVPDAPTFFGAREFCNRCHQCAEACPSGSIPSGEMTDSGPTPSNNPGVLKWYVNPETCLAFWRANGVSCANCIASCPFSRPGE